MSWFDDASGYAPDAPPPGQGACSWCGERQSSQLLVVMNADGTAGICEDCVRSHAEFFARRRPRGG
jgi:hypothetical protein